jgi:hypothetical protein
MKILQRVQYPKPSSYRLRFPPWFVAVPNISPHRPPVVSLDCVIKKQLALWGEKEVVGRITTWMKNGLMATTTTTTTTTTNVFPPPTFVSVLPKSTRIVSEERMCPPYTLFPRKPKGLGRESLRKEELKHWHVLCVNLLASVKGTEQ